VTSRRVRHYEIKSRLARGGMGVVHLAIDTRDGRLVALKQVETTEEKDAAFILKAERRGSELQREFGLTCHYVPEVYETFDEDGDFFIAMELVGGEDLSSVIGRSPLAPEHAARIAVHLCQFLQAAHSFQTLIDGRPGFLLHGDLTPRNIRLVDDDRVKVLDFGIAKAVSLTRRVTTNEFGNHAYLPPERLEHGTMNAEGDLWALGVVLYEMIRGERPFRGDTHAIERRILSRRPPEPLPHCPAGLAAIIARTLEGEAAKRYLTAGAILEDLNRFLAGEEPNALRDGWPERAYGPIDEPATRRTTRPVLPVLPAAQATNDDELPTRRTAVEFQPAEPLRHTPPPLLTASPLRARQRAWAPVAFVLFFALAGTVCANEGWVWAKARPLVAAAPTQEFAGLNEMWRQHRAMASRSAGLATASLRSALLNRTSELANNLFAAYHKPGPPIRDGRWKEAATALEHALTIKRNDPELTAGLRYAEGHIHRIQGETDRIRRLPTAHAHFDDAVAKFKEAAAKKPQWPDPYLGLLRTYAYDLDDITAAVEALKQAEAAGFKPGAREIAQIADGYKKTADRLRAEAETQRDQPGERDLLDRAAESYREAISRYSEIPDFGNASENLELCRDWLRRIERRLEEMDRWR
jgi:serine/threonine protein kinase